MGLTSTCHYPLAFNLFCGEELANSCMLAHVSHYISSIFILLMFMFILPNWTHTHTFVCRWGGIQVKNYLIGGTLVEKLENHCSTSKSSSFLTLLVLSVLHNPMDLHASHSFLGHFGRELVYRELCKYVFMVYFLISYMFKPNCYNWCLCVTFWHLSSS